MSFTLTEKQNERSNCTEISVWSSLVGVFCDAHIRSVVVHCVIIGFADTELWPAVGTPCDRVPYRCRSLTDWCKVPANHTAVALLPTSFRAAVCVVFLFSPPKMGKMGCVALPHVTSTSRSRVMICHRQVKPEPSRVWLTGGVIVVNKKVFLHPSHSAE